MYDAEVNPGAGWQLMGTSDFEDYRLKFIAQYNGNGGINLIKPFKTKNCCVAVKGGKKLTILLARNLATSSPQPVPFNCLTV
jgi:hypothetical protein